MGGAPSRRSKERLPPLSAADRLLKKALDAKRESKLVDFKSRLDVEAAGDWCEVIKDIVAMANSGGGAIVVGADNLGIPTDADVTSLLSLDPAKITDRIHKYTETSFGDFEIREVQKGSSHLAIILVGAVLIPMVFAKPGQYQDPADPKKQKTAFGQGTIFFRHGAKSEPGTTDDIRQAIDRRLGEIRKEWIGGVRKVVEAPSGSVVSVLARDIAASSSPTTVPIRVTDDPSAPKYQVLDPNKTHPHKTRDVITEINKRLPSGYKINTFDFQCLKKVHGVAGRPDFVYRNLWGSAQYSQALIDWVMEKFTRDSEFFTSCRATHKTLGK